MHGQAFARPRPEAVACSHLGRVMIPRPCRVGSMSLLKLPSRQVLCKGVWQMGGNFVVGLGSGRTHGRTHGRTLRAAAAEVEATEAPDAQLQVTEEKLRGAGRIITVTVPPALLQRAYQQELKYSRAKAQVPGFRKGKKVPDDVLVEFLGGPRQVKLYALDRMLGDVLPEALGPYAEKVLSDSIKVLDEVDNLANRLDYEKDFVFSVGFEVMEEVRWKEPYSNLKVEVQAPGLEDIEEEVEEMLLAARKQSGSLAVVANRSLNLGDVAIVDMVVRRDDTQEVIPGSERTKMRLDTAVADRDLGLPGLAEGMDGMSAGETRSISTKVPGAWWEPDAVGGAACTVDITVDELFSWMLPEETDEWANGVYNGSEGLAGLRARLREAAQERISSARDTAVTRALFEAVSRIVEVEPAESYIRETAENEYQSELLEAQAEGRMSYEQVQQIATDEMLQAFLTARRDDIEALVRATMGIEAIFAAEGLYVDPARLNAEIEQVAAEYKAAGDEIDMEQLRKQAEDAAKGREVFKWLQANCQVNILPLE